MTQGTSHDERVHILGIRHHGPGSARAVATVLAELDPEIVLIEGPPELDAVAPLAMAAGMRPPVAGLVYAVDAPATASFYPMAVFSPEWVALRWALEHDREVRFLDLPANVALVLGDSDDGTDDPDAQPPMDPIKTLATAAGFDDAERWWEDAVELRYHGMDVFHAVLDAMRTLREGHVPDLRTRRREAAMRRVLRVALRSEAERIAVVCGAWHAPVLVPSEFPTQTADTQLLKGLRTAKVAATWVPWTSTRLARMSGYGAGIESPGWYHHLFTAPDEVVSRWLVRVARLLRREQHDVSSAAVIEAVRLAYTLSAIRDRPHPGLPEVLESCQAALCGGSNVPMRLVARKLLVGDILGRVPRETPMVPLAMDLAKTRKRLRLKQSAAEQQLDLDLRTETNLARSKLLHRLLLLDVRWGERADTSRGKGTFRESWTLEWTPELEVALIEASGYGTTIESAATAVVAARTLEADIAELSVLVETTLTADLPAALGGVLAALDERAARQHDTTRLMAAVEPMARVRRYGNVRRADTEVVQRVLTGIVTRIAIGLPAACTALDEEAAAEVRELVDAVQRGIGLLDQEELRVVWYGALRSVADRQSVPGLIAGRAVRLLLDAGLVDVTDAAARLSRQLSLAADATQAAGWLEGFLSGEAALLVHEPELLEIVDEWATGVNGELFDHLLPLLRRTFAEFSATERRDIGLRVRRIDRGEGAAGGRGDDGDLDHERASLVVPRILELLR
ncbi:DUF5682 family protein [Actinophytocola algeriensis]|uniref:Uncharacterized protein n=1 Tax=Actinophytocola algeriensis TaxID=1768010 RepID=A0A7W7Q6U2_9PSEU|nr:DUF5682 family protein [Actinophytocola algeriensis]MBB4907913.1 hypothetical protein [Actinophytocola algeriensis]MBE1479943.1 hypothetical protein [Actinophytocola algeriensis]